jgi:HSP90 family molecular chaperone
MNSVDKLNKMLLSGVCPAELDFNNNQQNTEIDYNMVKYNAFYKSYEYAESKFPNGFEVIPAFDKIIEMCIPELTPLEELDMKNLLDKMKYNALYSDQLPLEEYQKQEEKDLKVLCDKLEEKMKNPSTCAQLFKEYEENIKNMWDEYNDRLQLE